jgi:protease-4
VFGLGDPKPQYTVFVPSSRRGVTIVLTVILLAVMVSAGGLLLLTAMFGNAAAPPAIPAEAALYLKIDAPFSEVAGVDWFGGFSDAPPVTLRSIVDEIHRAKLDARVKTLVIEPTVAGALWAQIQEVRDALTDFRTSGKHVTAYLESASAQEYYLASAADRIAMMPAGSLDLSGVATYELFFRGALDKLGIVPDLLHIGEYKTAANTFTEKGFTPAHREMDVSLNRAWFDDLVHGIAQGRKMTDDAVRQAIDAGPYLATEAKTAGLVDDLSYEDQVASSAAVKGSRRFEGDDYARLGGLTPGYGSGPRIALIYAVGEIVSGKSSADAPGGVLGAETFVEWVRKARVDPDVRAIVVRIDSPGGSAVASDVMWHELMLARDVKPVVVSMGDVAASGGYYIAVPANSIVAEPGTLTGSIGVVTGKYVVKDGLDKLGIGTDSVSDGANAEIDSPFSPFSKGARAKVEAQMQATYDLFVSRVAEGRHLSATQVDAMGRGRVWTGSQGKAHGLVDEIGGLDLAMQIAKSKAHIAQGSSVSLSIYPPRRGVLDLLASLSNSSSSEHLTASLGTSGVRAFESAVALARLVRPGEMLMVMPDVFWR